jgi:hypothetical protein
MLAEHLKEALAQVRQLQMAVVERQRFRGYSGWARIFSGSLALVAAAVMSMPPYPETTRAHVLGWGGVFVVSLLLNSGALLYWFINDPRVERDVFRLRPIIDALIPLVVGGALTFTMIVHGFHQYLFGVWMCMFGLSNLASRYVLPPTIALVGLFYVFCGVAWLLSPFATFLNPWPMGTVFFAGEWAGGLILHFDERRYLSIVRSMDVEEPAEDETGKGDEQ